jgi:DNA-directed RNA polymerase specialized sigma24 family protein
MSLDSARSISHWLAQFKQGDAQAFEPLWERYFDKLVCLARKKLRAARHLPSDQDEEDVALSAFNDFCAGVKRGGFPRLNNRDDLWRVLVHLTACKAVDRKNRSAAKRRGGGRVALETDLNPGRDGEGAFSLDNLAGMEPSPELAHQLAEQCQIRIDRLTDPTLRRIALLKLACYTNEEICKLLDCSLRSVTLKLELIRRRWQSEKL